LVKAEAVAAKRRYEVEKAVHATRADLLVPLETAKTDAVATATVTAQPTATPTP
jgi:hypothetical protein